MAIETMAAGFMVAVSGQAIWGVGETADAAIENAREEFTAADQYAEFPERMRGQEPDESDVWFCAPATERLIAAVRARGGVVVWVNVKGVCDLADEEG